MFGKKMLETYFCQTNFIGKRKFSNMQTFKMNILKSSVIWRYNSTSLSIFTLPLLCLANFFYSSEKKKKIEM